jgi:hypothetical protein
MLDVIELSNNHILVQRIREFRVRVKGKKIIYHMVKEQFIVRKVLSIDKVLEDVLEHFDVGRFFTDYYFIFEELVLRVNEVVLRDADRLSFRDRVIGRIFYGVSFLQDFRELVFQVLSHEVNGDGVLSSSEDDHIGEFSSRADVLIKSGFNEFVVST